MTRTSSATDCSSSRSSRPGLTGTLVGTGVESFQSVRTSQGFHTEGTVGGTGRIDWSHGSYTLIDAVDRFSFNAVGKGTAVFSETHTESGDFFSAGGVFQGRRTFHEVEHVTVTNGVVQVDLTKGHMHFLGDC